MRIVLLLICYLFLSLTDSVARPPKVKILFVGNSLTYTNDLPSLISKLARKKKISVQTEMLAFPNYALEDHWNEGKLQKLIQSGEFDFVVVQQGPSSQQDGKRMLDDYGRKIQELCQSSQTKLAFYMVWPARINYHMFDGVIQNYTDAAINNNALLCPVGKIWKEYMDRTQDFSYYGPDGFHPSVLGSQAAAEIIFKILFP